MRLCCTGKRLMPIPKVLLLLVMVSDPKLAAKYVEDIFSYLRDKEHEYISHYKYIDLQAFD